MFTFLLKLSARTACEISWAAQIWYYVPGELAHKDPLKRSSGYVSIGRKDMWLHAQQVRFSLVRRMEWTQPVFG